MKKFLLISGSLRKESYNTKLCHVIKNILTEKQIEVEIMTLHEIPMFNQDLEHPSNPEVVEAFKQKVTSADAVIISTPEYNHMVPGVLKNAIEWLAGGNAHESVLEHKKIAIVGASPGGFGTARSQDQLLLLLAHLKAELNGRRFPISKAGEVFDEAGNMIDEKVKQRLVTFLEDFINDQ